MTADELIAALLALPAEQRALPVYFDADGRWDEAGDVRVGELNRFDGNDYIWIPCVKID